jgi:small ligand-binding sensory domain FIST
MLIGEKHRITRSDANVIIELDGRRALSVFKEDVGELLARDLKRIEGYIFAALPVRGSDTGDYMVRHIVGFDLSQELVGVSEIVETGQSIQFCRRDARAAEEDLVRMIGSLKRRANAAPRGAVYYSCVARGPHMFGEESNELRLIERELGDVPLVGFFCNGEISHNRLYGYTGVLTLFL